MILRLLAVLVGLGVLAATAHVTVLATGGYGSAHAPLTLAIAAGVGIGALVIGVSWSERRRTLAVAIAVALFSGELFALAMTGERLVAQREAAQAPAREAAAARATVLAEIAELEAALAGAATSPRLTRALEAQQRLTETVAGKAAERGCAGNCRALLEGQVRAAALEIAEARAELEKRRADLATSLAGLRGRLTALAPPVSGTPLADRLGLPPWLLDLIVASLGAIGANGLAATLIAFGAHRPRPPAAAPAGVPAGVPAAGPAAEAAGPPIATTIAPPVDSDPSTAPPAVARRVVSPPRLIRGPAPVPTLQPVGDATQHGARFGLERLTPAPEARLALTDLHAAYRAWCADVGSEELPAKEIAAVLARLFADAGIVVETTSGRPEAVGVRIIARASVRKARAEAA